jgi:hypothetical protein
MAVPANQPQAIVALHEAASGRAAHASPLVDDRPGNLDPHGQRADDGLKRLGRTAVHVEKLDHRIPA